MFTSIFREEDPGEMYQVPANDEEEKRGEKRKINENENEKNHVVPEFEKSLVVPESPVSTEYATAHVIKKSVKLSNTYISIAIF